MRAEFGQNTLLKKPIKYDRTSYSEEAAAATQNKLSINTNPNKECDTFLELKEEECTTVTSKPCVLQIRFLDGSTVKTRFHSEDKLSVVADYVMQFINQRREELRKRQKRGEIIDIEQDFEAYDAGIRLSILFPRKKFDNRTLSTTTIKESGLFPKGSIAVERDDSAYGYKYKENRSEKVYVPINYLKANAPWRLRGDSYEEKEKFRKKMRETELQEKELEKRKKN
jgi:hypothetical protein